jgi:hypothetical protein
MGRREGAAEIGRRCHSDAGTRCDATRFCAQTRLKACAHPHELSPECGSAQLRRLRRARVQLLLYQRAEDHYHEESANRSNDADGQRERGQVEDEVQD